jgi:D-erythronate 2-dehydrogenase
MNVLITGGAGFLGAALARELVAGGIPDDENGARQRISRLTLVDIAPPRPLEDPCIRIIVGSISDPDVVNRALGADTDVVFHLAAIVSGQAEADFDLGMRANFDATRLLLERARHNENRPRFVFASSVAVYGGAVPPVVQDDTAPTPQSSYGVQKLMCELLVSDYSRKGFVDGRALRMPTICVRPGAPNKAASSFASSIVREPLAGKETICPVSPETRMWLMSPHRAIENLLHGQALQESTLNAVRVINMPGLSATVREMVDALERIAGPTASRYIRWEPDPAIARLVNSWPGRFSTPRAAALGFKADASFDDIVRAHAAETGATSSRGETDEGAAL